MGLGKVRHLNTSWLWVQEKEASRELRYQKVRSSDNSADLFTKARDHDSIRRHTESMGSEFVFGRDPLAFTVNSLSAKVSMEKVAMEMDRRERMDENGHSQQNFDNKHGRTDLEIRRVQSNR